MDKIRINLFDLLMCLSNAGDLASPVLASHHQKVAYLSYRLAEHMKLPNSQQREILLASLIHDIGALSMNERLELVESEPASMHKHSFRGAKLLNSFDPLKNTAKIIKFHHIPWNFGEGTYYKEEQVPLSSHIIHLADRVCIKLDSIDYNMTQLNDVLSIIKKDADILYKPELVDTLIDISEKDYIWLDLLDRSPVNMLSDILCSFDILVLEIDDIIDISRIFSHIIDFRSRYTACHSAGVAKTAEKLALLFNFSPIERKMILIAGYLHDLGKLAIDDAILEKPSKLSNEEFAKIRSHTYYTYQLLKSINRFETINKWASFHHEKINGKGYPFHICGDNLSLGSRIMAVADIFTAITEDRPYRKGMNEKQAAQVLINMVNDGSIDERIVGILLNNFQQINKIRDEAQKAARLKYENFLIEE